MDPNEQQQNSQDPQLIKPEQMFNPSVPSYQPPQAPQQPAPQQPMPPQGSPEPNQTSYDDGVKKRRILIVIVGSLVALFIIIILIVVLTSSGDNKKQAQNNQNTQSSGIFIQPSALDIQNANNSITSDITSLNDDSDFPTANLSDTSLRL